MRKIITLGIMLLFLGMTISSSTGLYLEKQSIKPISSGNILYVGGNGTGNYSKIQDAINDSSDGDTVFVYDDSSPYYENLIVDKSINLIGENRETTVINGSDSEIVVNISSDNVFLSGFTVLNHGNSSSHTSIIFIQSNYNIISGNIIKVEDDYGIEIIYSEYTTISDNTITGNTSESWIGIFIYEGKNNNISRNIIKNFKSGIVFGYSNNYSIYGNTLIDNTFAINPAGFSINDVISLNNISGSLFGIYALNCFNYKIIKNNFIGNLRNAGFGYYLGEFFVFGFKYRSIRDIRSTIKWDGNYWNRPRSFPKPILGELPPYGIIRWFQFDWNPASEPYDI
ncbi:MAG: right-handed parallel beta-helix repeat-containing protein [Thermoplasmatales archaeon]|nr:right-handed parallel beta-helix repeat-containing protein [Thermoplasmatales archaeon]